jgi:hypothetical protein
MFTSYTKRTCVSILCYNRLAGTHGPIPSEPLKCQLCSTSLHKLSAEQRQAHYDRHFTEEQEPQGGWTRAPMLRENTKTLSPMLASSSSLVNPLNPHGNIKPGARPRRPDVNAPPAKQNVFWYQAHSTAPPDAFTPGSFSVSWSTS